MPDGIASGIEEEINVIRRCTESELATILEIINLAAQAYEGVIPDDRWKDPYMPLEELRHEIDDGVVFWGMEHNGQLLGVMGMQDKGDVALIRHAYVRPHFQKRGVGAKLLQHLEGMTQKTILVGTWAAATWAILFYQRHGYVLVSDEEKNRLLKKHWSVPKRQIETSVVLAKHVHDRSLPQKPASGARSRR